MRFELYDVRKTEICAQLDWENHQKVLRYLDGFSAIQRWQLRATGVQKLGGFCSKTGLFSLSNASAAPLQCTKSVRPTFSSGDQSGVIMSVTEVDVAADLLVPT